MNPKAEFHFWVPEMGFVSKLIKKLQQLACNGKTTV
jgi:hypothetical protein